jgi:hypothetical protein
MRDDQVRRYARHVLLPDVGGVGQRALLTATVHVDATRPAGRIAATYLAAGGVGTIAATGATDDLLAELARINPDARVVGQVPTALDVDLELPEPPPWWPGDADTDAFAWWAGSLAAVRAMTRIVES